MVSRWDCYYFTRAELTVQSISVSLLLSLLRLDVHASATYTVACLSGEQLTVA